MSTDVVIRVENLSKKYTLGGKNGRRPGDGLRHILQDAVAAPFRQLRRRILTDRSSASSAAHSDRHSEKSEFWALKDISLEVKRGEVVGIIGRNGAGKSTLLKILSRITEPTSGRIGIKGRVASLLEVGTGFHPELTGRENIYLNGAILGMTRAEIKNKFDPIVAFAEVEKFLETPVKHYSSGMYVRLAFSVAAHLEPEILVVDEVLAVGDAEFQKKSMGKMQDIATGGRTVLFVSHNLSSISALSSCAVVLERGTILFNGEVSTALDKYFQLHSELAPPSNYKSQGDQEDHAAILSIYTADSDGCPVSVTSYDAKYYLYLEINRPSGTILDFGFTIFNSDNIGIFSSQLSDSKGSIPDGVSKFRIQLPTYLLNSGLYRIEGALMGAGAQFQSDCFARFEITSRRPADMQGARSKGLLKIAHVWENL